MSCSTAAFHNTWSTRKRIVERSQASSMDVPFQLGILILVISVVMLFVVQQGDNNSVALFFVSIVGGLILVAHLNASKKTDRSFDIVELVESIAEDAMLCSDEEVRINYIDESALSATFNCCGDPWKGSVTVKVDITHNDDVDRSSLKLECSDDPFNIGTVYFSLDAEIGSSVDRSLAGLIDSNQ